MVLTVEHKDMFYCSNGLKSMDLKAFCAAFGVSCVSIQLEHIWGDEVWLKVSDELTTSAQLSL